MSFNHTGVFTGTTSVYLEIYPIIDALKVTHESSPEFAELLRYAEEDGEITINVKVEYEFGSKSGAEILDILEMEVQGLSEASSKLIIKHYQEVIHERAYENEDLSPF